MSRFIVPVSLCLGLTLSASGCGSSNSRRAPDDADVSADGPAEDGALDAQSQSTDAAQNAQGDAAPTDAATDGGEIEPAAPPPPWQSFTATGPGYSVVIAPRTERGLWEGWGASLAWWANGVGESEHTELYADLFFTLKNVTVLGRTLPGLGLSIVRYNVGGGGRPGDIAGVAENVPAELPWFKDIDGFAIDWSNLADETSSTWDFTRDSRQRNVLAAALARGVTHVELFANAPMWWMTEEKSSAGGKLQSWNRADFARSLATVAAHARTSWGVRNMTVEPFNEPTAGWWTYPKGQEGCNLDVDAQAEILVALREALDARGLTDVQISASDENSMTDALRTLSALEDRTVRVHGIDVRADALVGQLNVHSYSGLDPFRDNGARTALRARAGARKLWASEYGDPDGSGMALAQTVTEDIAYLRPTAFVYWQPLEPYSGWGFLNGAYADAREQPNRGAPTWVYTKYFVFAQLTRFVRPGSVLLESNDHNSIVAHEAYASTLSIVTVNFGEAQVIRYDLHAFDTHDDLARVTYTRTDGSHVFERFDAPIVDHMLEIPAEANSVYSVRIERAMR